jgi:high affinity cGMP-specific 3',5'-cyclic phosphodiesterase 9
MHNYFCCSNGQVSAEVCDYLKKLSFDNWQWDDSEMIILMRQMFVDLNLLTVFKIEVWPSLMC